MNKDKTYKYPYRRKTVKGKSVLEHRWVMEQHLGRKLLPNEEIHHIDGNKRNNDIANLEVFTDHIAHIAKDIALGKFFGKRPTGDREPLVFNRRMNKRPTIL